MGLFGHKTKVEMLVSVAGVDGEFIAGKQYKLEPELADRYIARGYCTGGMSRVYDDDEMQRLKGNQQRVTL